jgi:hypothetical protein
MPIVMPIVSFLTGRMMEPAFGSQTNLEPSFTANIKPNLDQGDFDLRIR